MLQTKISIFKNIKDSQNPYDRPVSDFLNRIKEGSNATNLVLKYRETKDDKYKQALPCCTFSGTFTRRRDADLVDFSQFACLDFDKFEDEAEVLKLKNKLSKEPSLFCAFISPSGKGLKAIFRVENNPERYESLYRALCIKYDDEHIDKGTKDISRCCYESYDPDIYINANAKEWNIYEEEEYTHLGVERYNVVVPLKSESRIIDNIQKWFDKKYSMSEGDRNNNVFKFACALNAYGINEITTLNYLQKYAQKGFTSKEIEQAIKSAYKRYKGEFNTRAFEDNETRIQIQKAVSSGKTKQEIKKDFEKKNNPIVGDDALFEEILETVKTSESVDVFWNINEKGKIILDPFLFEQYLKSNNFMKFYPESSSDTFIFVKKNKSLIEETNRDKIKDFVLNDLKTRKDIGFAPYNYMAMNTKYFSNDFLNMLESVEIEIKKDTADQCFLYYKNCVVEVGKDYVKEIDYLNIDKYVWQDSVIERDFKIFDHHKCVFRSFIWYISGQNKDAYNSFKSAIGYLLHSYKTQADNKAIILNDEIITDEPNGRSGKGVFFNGIKQLKKLVALNGKKIDLNSQFAFQTVKADCQVLVFDDVKRNFPFEDLFSIITEGLEIEYKGQGAIKLPVTKSPKIVITTNYTIKGEGGSFDARKFELELSSYFNSKFSPKDKFGHMFFDEWDSDEWSRFDNFMIQCIQYYLVNGLQNQNHKNLEERKYISETSQDFHEWTKEGHLEEGKRYYNSNSFDLFIEEYPDYRNKLTIKTFKKWIKKYCEFNKLKYSDGTANSLRYFYISKDNETIIDDCPF